MKSSRVTIVLIVFVMLFACSWRSHAVNEWPVNPVFGIDVQQSNGAVIISWETADDFLTIGFNLYRSENGGAFERLNEHFLLAPEDAPAGASYSWRDSDVAEMKSYCYKLEAYSPRGPYPMIDMLCITVGAKGTVDGTSQDAYRAVPRKTQRREKTIVKRDALKASRSSIAAGTQMKMKVREKGVYLADLATISAHLGMTTNEAKEHIAKRLFRLSSQGQQIAWVPDDEGILFYNEPIQSIYTPDNVFWLECGRGLVVPPVTGPPPQSAASTNLSYIETTHQEQNNSVVAYLLSDPETNYWYWGVNSAGSGSTTMPFYVDCVAWDVTNSSVVVKFLAKNTMGVEDEHDIVMSVNGTDVGHAVWDGMEYFTGTVDFSTHLLSNGWNSFSLRGELPTNVLASVVYWDWFDVSYPRRFSAWTNSALLAPFSSATATVTGMTDSDLQVWSLMKRSEPRAVDAVMVVATNAGYSISFSNEYSEGEYYIFSRTAIRSATNVSARSDRRSLCARSNRVDYLVISDEMMELSLQPLLAHRSSQGLSCRLVPVGDIYDDFNDGIASPFAIRQFLEYANTNWADPPTYVLLAGEGTYDYHGYKGTGESIVPAKMVETPYVLTCSDNWFVDFSGDGAPQIAIGRIPAETSQMMSDVVAKILEYESNVQSDDWTNRVIMSADKPDSGGNFPASSDMVASVLPPGVNVEEIHLSDMDVALARPALIDSLQDGVCYFNYLGHGAWNFLSAERLLVSADIPLLTNGLAMPVVLGMTCYVNNFANPGYDYIGELLMLEPGGGAIASWAPSSLSFNSMAQYIDLNFFTNRYAQNMPTLGSAVRAALQTEADRGIDVFELTQFILLGDPALQMR